MERLLRRYLDMALGPQVVDLGGLGLVNDLHQTVAIDQITVVQHHLTLEQKMSLINSAATNRFCFCTIKH